MPLPSSWTPEFHLSLTSLGLLPSPAKSCWPMTSTPLPVSASSLPLPIRSADCHTHGCHQLRTSEDTSDIFHLPQLPSRLCKQCGKLEVHACCCLLDVNARAPPEAHQLHPASSWTHWLAAARKSVLPMALPAAFLCSVSHTCVLALLRLKAPNSLIKNNSKKN